MRPEGPPPPFSPSPPSSLSDLVTSSSFFIPPAVDSELADSLLRSPSLTKFRSDCEGGAVSNLVSGRGDCDLSAAGMVVAEEVFSSIVHKMREVDDSFFVRATARTSERGTGWEGKRGSQTSLWNSRVFTTFSRLPSSLTFSNVVTGETSSLSFPAGISSAVVSSDLLQDPFVRQSLLKTGADRWIVVASFKTFKPLSDFRTALGGSAAPSAVPLFQNDLQIRSV